MGFDKRIGYITGYVLLWSAQALLIKGSLRTSGEESSAAATYPYEVMAVTISIETLKLVLSLCVIFLTKEESTATAPAKMALIRSKFTDGLWMIVPAAIYGLYNGLSFVNIRLLEPATYRVLINGRIIFSGVLLQYFFDKRLTIRQWAALVLLVMACVVEQSGTFSLDGGIFAILMMSLQGLCSSLGAVYFQWLLQRQEAAGASGPPMGMWMKNLYLYLWSIIANVVGIVVFRPDLLYPSALFVNFDMNVVPIVIVAAFGGVFTSLLLRHLDVIMKEYANFAEMIVVAVAQWLMFSTPIRMTSLIAIAMVSYSIYMYQTSAKPVVTKIITLSKSSKTALISPDEKRRLQSP